ncbi:hypothetical protein BD414DRAFT_495373 [Trametes punicea]|nr:hypothetical protein BD414DRAFT_495373 [Trametes punicea]
MMRRGSQRGARGKGNSSRSGALSIRLPPPGARVTQPSSPLLEKLPLDDTGPRRSGRVVQATRNADPELMESMRPGYITHHPDAERSPGDGPDDLTYEDVEREQGEGDMNDEDYLESARPGARRIVGPLNSSVPANIVISASEKTPVRHSSMATTAGAYMPTFPQEVLALLRSPALMESLVHQQVSVSPSLPTPALSREGSWTSSESSSPGAQASNSSISRHPIPSLFSLTQPLSNKRDLTIADTMDREGQARLKKAKHNASRPRHHQYRADNPHFSSALKMTSRLIQLHLATVDPFPSPTAREELIKSKYTLAVTELQLDPERYMLGTKEIKMLNDEETNMRGRVKKAIAHLISRFGFHRVARDSAEIEFNINLRHELLGSSPLDAFARDPAFHYKDIKARQGRFLNPIIAEAISATFFAYPGALGCIAQTEFTPFPHAAFALILTALEHGIEQYSSGAFDSTMRFSKDYKERYMSHLNSLKEYEDVLVWKTYRKKLVRDGLAYAGAEVEKHRINEPSTAPKMSQEMIAAEMARLEEEELNGFVDSSDVERDVEDESILCEA